MCSSKHHAALRKQSMGALYEIPEYLLSRETAKAQGRRSLDGIEGKKYRRRPIEIIRPDGKLLTCITYVAAEPEVGLKTNVEYVSYIVKGLRERGVPESYIAEVKVLAVDNNPAITEKVGEL